MSRSWPWVICVGAVACRGPGPAATDTAETSCDCGPETPPQIEVEIRWDDAGLAGTVHNLPGTGFDLGLAETGATTPWNGEDCYQGTAGYTVCHSFWGNTAALTPVAAPDDVVAGRTTLLDADLAYNGDGTDRITYMMTVDAGDCFTWGQDVAYYSTFGCAAATLW